jgi:DNA gyrase/topoisomerase IV subunit A
MIRKDDVKWWVAEVERHPEAAASIVEELADRLIALDAENERLRDELIKLERRAPTGLESDQVSALRNRVATLQALVDSEMSDEPYLAFLADHGQSARMPVVQAHKLAREEKPVLGKQEMVGVRRLLIGRPREHLILLTSQMRGLKDRFSAVPLLTEGKGWPGEGRELGENEWLTAAATAAREPRFWTIVTRRGFVRQLIRIDFDRRVEKGEPLIESPFPRDVPVAIVDGDEGDLLVATRWGKVARFPQRSIEGGGATALELEPDDEIAAAIPLKAEANVLAATAAGFVVRRGADQFPAQPRPGGKGKSCIQAFDVLGAFGCEPEDRIAYLTYSGKVLFAAVSDIPLYTRSSKGARVFTLDRDPAVAAAIVPSEQ